MRKLTTLTAAIMAMGLLAGCTETTVEPTESEAAEKKMAEAETETVTETAPVEETPVEEEPTEEAAPAEPAVAQVGDTLDVNGVKITVTGIEPYTGQINQFEPLTQDHAVKIGLIIENTTSETIMPISNEFKLYDVDDFELTDALPSSDPRLMNEIAGGKKIQAALYYDVPVQEGTWELIYEPMMSLGGDTAVWEVPAK